MTPETILLATDLSCRCDRALDRAVLLAAQWNARLIVLHVVQYAAPVSNLPSWRQPPSQLEMAETRLHRDLPNVEGVTIEIMVERGDPASIILDVSARLNCELIITGVARDEPLGRMALGTTVEALARKSEIPVLIVKVRPRNAYENVVVATDFSESSRAALVATLQLLPEAQLRLLHTFEVPYENLSDDKMPAREAMAEAAFEESRRFLVATPEVTASNRHIEIHCEAGEITRFLQDLVQDCEVDLIVLGNEGRSEIAERLLGGTAHRIMTRIFGDILLVRESKRTAQTRTI